MIARIRELEAEVLRVKAAHSDSVTLLQGQHKKALDSMRAELRITLDDFWDVREALGLPRLYDGGESALAAAKRIVEELETSKTANAAREDEVFRKALAQGRREGWSSMRVRAAKIARDRETGDVARAIECQEWPTPSEWPASLSYAESAPKSLVERAKSALTRYAAASVKEATDTSVIGIVRDLAAATPIEPWTDMPRELRQRIERWKYADDSGIEYPETSGEIVSAVNDWLHERPFTPQAPRCDTCEREADLLGESCSTGERTWAFCSLCLANQRDAAESAAQRAKFADAEAERWAKRVIELEADRTKIRSILDRLQ